METGMPSVPGPSPERAERVTLGLGVKQPRFSAGLVLSDTGGRWGGSDERVDIVKRLSESWFHL